MEEKLKTVTRFEVIGDSGRILVKHEIKQIELSFQDENRTLKVFIKEEVE